MIKILVIGIFASVFCFGAAILCLSSYFVTGSSIGLILGILNAISCVANGILAILNAKDIDDNFFS